MSYDIELKDPVTGEVIELDHVHGMRSGTYALGGTTAAELNITYTTTQSILACSGKMVFVRFTEKPVLRVSRC